ncbi:hypothetical protein TELCIR_16560 [Teladorsagia circumcincta]|uniref:Methyltransferase small domain protein n=1 Tax=Teladorsagia circumcincta TaxID=45464 RepID=A0A2G9TV54_TELCI|nr:hypothetical protein TELCIR_16560 [Teladorsagia circumcincta]
MECDKFSINAVINEGDYAMYIYYTIVLLITEVAMTSSAVDTQALVLYDDNQTPLKRFSAREKSVTIGSFVIHLKQSWNENGVAGVLWDSAIVLSEYLDTHPDLIRGHQVLELGAGLGLPSIVAAKLSGKSVMATDQPSAISLLRENIVANLREEEMSAVSIVPLDWANLPDQPLSADIILGADLVYNEEVFEALRKVITQLITTDNVMLMASKIRYPKDKRFYETLRDDFDVTQNQPFCVASRDSPRIVDEYDRDKERHIELETREHCQN